MGVHRHLLFPVIGLAKAVTLSGALGAVAAVAIASVAHAGTITTTTLAAFDVPSVLDFESADTGPVSNTSTIFTSFGILSISATATNVGFSEFFDGGVFASGNSLFADVQLTAGSSGPADLHILSPGTTFSFDNPVYTVNLAQVTDKFGVSFTDTSSTFHQGRLEFFLNAVSVGVFEFSTSDVYNAQTTHYFLSDMVFNTVIISSLNDTSVAGFGDGWGIDNLTIEAPEPSTLALFATGLTLLAFFGWRRRGSVQSKAA